MRILKITPCRHHNVYLCTKLTVVRNRYKETCHNVNIIHCYPKIFSYKAPAISSKQPSLRTGAFARTPVLRQLGIMPFHKTMYQHQLFDVYFNDSLVCTRWWNMRQLKGHFGKTHFSLLPNVLGKFVWSVQRRSLKVVFFIIFL